MTSSTRRTAIVTGASRGIGRAIALRLARDGFAVAVNFAGNVAKADEVVHEIESIGGRAIAVRADIADGSAVDHLFEKTRAVLGAIDVVVNSAGIFQPSPIAEGDLALFERLVATNLRGAFIVLVRAARHVSAGGRIIALSTSAIARAFPNYGAYVATKAGTEALVRVLANELRGRNITVNAVAPGPVATEMFLSVKSESEIAEAAKLPPLERLGEPDDIAGVVSFLAGADGGWINGQVLRANGGYA